MTANTEPVYWTKDKSWYSVNREKDCYELTDEAPERAVKSFEMHKEINGLNQARNKK